MVGKWVNGWHNIIVCEILLIIFSLSILMFRFNICLLYHLFRSCKFSFVLSIFFSAGITFNYIVNLLFQKQRVLFYLSFEFMIIISPLFQLIIVDYQVIVLILLPKISLSLLFNVHVKPITYYGVCICYSLLNYINSGLLNYINFVSKKSYVIMNRKYL